MKLKLWMKAFAPADAERSALAALAQQHKHCSGRLGFVLKEEGPQLDETTKQSYNAHRS